MEKKKAVKGAALFLSMAMMLTALAGCGTSGGGDEDTLTFSGPDIVSFNLFNTSAGTDILFDGMYIGESLITLNNDFVYEPQLCEKFDVSADGLVYTFYVRPDVTFHNGQKLTAADVVYSFEKMKTAPLTAEFGEYITDVTVTDDMTVAITLASPQFSFLYTLYAFGVIVPDGIFETDYDWEAHPIGTGAYEFVDYVPGDKMILKAYKDYYIDGQPKVENLIYKIITDASTAVLALESDELDYLIIDPSAVSLLEGNDNIEITSFPTLNTYISWMDITKPPFDDLNVRLALNHAVDRDTLATVLGQAGYEAAKSYTSPSNYGHSGAGGDDYDVEKAKSLLASSKYAGQEISFVMTTREASKPIAEFLQETFRGIGITTTIEIVDSSAFGSGLINKDFAFGISKIGTGLLASMNSMMFATGAAYNMMNYSNVQVDALFAQAAGSLDDAERLSCYAQIDQFIEADAPFIPLLWEKTVLAYNKKVDVEGALFYTCGDVCIPPKLISFK